MYHIYISSSLIYQLNFKMTNTKCYRVNGIKNSQRSRLKEIESLLLETRITIRIPLGYFAMLKGNWLWALLCNPRLPLKDIGTKLHLWECKVLWWRALWAMERGSFGNEASVWRPLGDSSLGCTGFFCHKNKNQEHKDSSLYHYNIGIVWRNSKYRSKSQGGVNIKELPKYRYAACTLGHLFKEAMPIQ